jgi:hypothetical protein
MMLDLIPHTGLVQIDDARLAERLGVARHMLDHHASA